MNAVLRHLRRAALLHNGAGLTDGQLLERFLAEREEAAFEALVLRHAAMVLCVCRRVLRNEDDAEDAFQATFLVLVRKAGSIKPRELVGHWLYGVAYRTAVRARALDARRRMKERAMPTVRSPGNDDLDELLPLLDDELSRLPEKYRVPIVLCDLEGKSRKDVANTLGWPEGTLSGRLARARALLGKRLARRGVVLPAAGLLSALGVGAVAHAAPPALVTATTRAAMVVATGRALTAGLVSASVLALSEGVLKTMLLSKLKVLCVAALAVSVSAGAVGLSFRAAAADPKQAPERPRLAGALSDELDEMRLEIDALRKGLQATRERVRDLESELQSVRQSLPPRFGGRAGGSGGGFGQFGGGGTAGMLGGGALGMQGGGAMGMPGGGMGPPGGFSGGAGFSGGTGKAGAGSGGRGFPGGGGFSGVPPATSGSAPGEGASESYGQRKGARPASSGPKAADDPLAEALFALQQLQTTYASDPRSAQNKEAVERLERAVQRLRERATANDRKGN
jgi:RNA polymerase sigma factor (sigma-70 family)